MINAEYKYRIHKDSDGDTNEMELNFPGFIDSWAYVTGDEKNTYWEFDLCSIDGMDMHFIIPYTINQDILETVLLGCINKFDGLVKQDSK